MFGYRQVICSECEDAGFVSACNLDNDGDMDMISASGDDDKIAWYASGHHRIAFNSAELPAGLYLYRIKTSTLIKVQKMLLMK